MESQNTLTGQFDEAESKRLLKVAQQDRLELALAAVGIRPKHTAYRVALLIHHVAVGDGLLRWSATRIARDRGRSERSVRMARGQLQQLGIIEFESVPSIDGGDDIKAMRIDRRSVEKLALSDSETTPKVQNLQGARHPERHPANHPERHPANHPANSIAPIKNHCSTGPLVPPTTEPDEAGTAPVVVVGEFSMTMDFGLGPNDLPNVQKKAKWFRKLCKLPPNELATALVWKAACLDVATGWSCYDPARAIGNGTARNPVRFLEGCLKRAAAAAEAET